MKKLDDRLIRLVDALIRKAGLLYWLEDQGTRAQAAEITRLRKEVPDLRRKVLGHLIRRDEELRQYRKALDWLHHEVERLQARPLPTGDILL